MKDLTPQIAGIYIGCQVETPQGIGKIWAPSNTGFCQVFFEERSAPNNYANFYYEDIFLILRSIESITEDEAEDLWECHFGEAWWPICGSPLDWWIGFKCAIDLDDCAPIIFKLAQMGFDIDFLLISKLAIER